eukprot:TRINITY_DN4201_c0_g1_i1.p1 TRINITY_DN4201_c0_g1~~TRINITY_DN4201_c0_g1_i1.p1  ORF type:complete len:870 (-),score=123.67 TRINITY_DN4201_c0_g1_i1:52-2463(-)
MKSAKASFPVTSYGTERSRSNGVTGNTSRTATLFASESLASVLAGAIGGSIAVALLGMMLNMAGLQVSSSVAPTQQTIQKADSQGLTVVGLRENAKATLRSGHVLQRDRLVKDAADCVQQVSSAASTTLVNLVGVATLAGAVHGEARGRSKVDSKDMNSLGRGRVDAVPWHGLEKDSTGQFRFSTPGGRASAAAEVMPATTGSATTPFKDSLGRKSVDPVPWHGLEKDSTGLFRFGMPGGKASVAAEVMTATTSTATPPFEDSLGRSVDPVPWHGLEKNSAGQFRFGTPGGRASVATEAMMASTATPLLKDSLGLEDAANAPSVPVPRSHSLPQRFVGNLQRLGLHIDELGAMTCSKNKEPAPGSTANASRTLLMQDDAAPSTASVMPGNSSGPHPLPELSKNLAGHPQRFVSNVQRLGLHIDDLGAFHCSKNQETAPGAATNASHTLLMQDDAAPSTASFMPAHSSEPHPCPELTKDTAGHPQRFVSNLQQLGLHIDDQGAFHCTKTPPGATTHATRTLLMEDDAAPTASFMPANSSEPRPLHELTKDAAGPPQRFVSNLQQLGLHIDDQGAFHYSETSPGATTHAARILLMEDDAAPTASFMPVNSSEPHPLPELTKDTAGPPQRFVSNLQQLGLHIDDQGAFHCSKTPPGATTNPSWTLLMGDDAAPSTASFMPANSSELHPSPVPAEDTASRFRVGMFADEAPAAAAGIVTPRRTIPRTPRSSFLTPIAMLDGSTMVTTVDPNSSHSGKSGQRVPAVAVAATAAGSNSTQDRSGISGLATGTPSTATMDVGTYLMQRRQ